MDIHMGLCDVITKGDLPYSPLSDNNLTYGLGPLIMGRI